MATGEVGEHRRGGEEEDGEGFVDCECSFSIFLSGHIRLYMGLLQCADVMQNLSW